MISAEQALQFLSINSISREGNEEIINFLIPHFEDLGAKVVQQQVYHSVSNFSNRQFNLIGILGDDLVDAKTSKGLLLLTHVDTPSAGNLSDWDTLNNKPWVPKREENKFIGLGAANAKLDFLCKLKACTQFAKESLAQPIYLVATCGGESPVQGAKYLMQSKILNPKYVLIGHPSNLHIVNHHKAKSVAKVNISFLSVDRDTQSYNTRITIKTKGRGSLASTPSNGDCAIVRILKLLRTLRKNDIRMKLFSINGGEDLNRVADSSNVSIVVMDSQLDDFRRQFREYIAKNPQEYFELSFGGTGSEGVRLFPEEVLDSLFEVENVVKQRNEEFAAEVNDEFNPSVSTCVINQVEHDQNVISVTLYFSLLPEIWISDARKELEVRLQKDMVEIGKNYSKLSIRYRNIVSSPPLYTDENSTYIKTLLACMDRSGIDSKVINGAASTEASYFSEKGIATVAFGPGVEEKNSHAPNEFVEDSQLDAATRFYSQVIESFCLRGI